MSWQTMSEVEANTYYAAGWYHAKLLELTDNSDYEQPAIEQLRRAIVGGVEAVPLHKAYYDLIGLLLGQGRDTRSVLQEARQRVPNDETIEDLYQILQEGERDLNNAPTLSMVYNKMGKHFFREKDYARAIDYFQQAIEMHQYFSDPNLDELPYRRKFLYLGSAHFQLAQYAQTRDIYKILLPWELNNSELLFELAIAYNAQGQRTAALDIYDRLKRFDELRASELAQFIER